MNMLSHEYLLGFLEVVGKELDREITLVGVGGTAMTLLNLKPSTIDVDFTGPSKDIDEFDRILKSIPHGMKIDTWNDGQVFSQQLPPDYIQISIRITEERDIKNIELRALHPIDIIATKIGRFIQRDLEDIKACLDHYKIKKRDLLERAQKVKESYVGNEKVYQMNLDKVIMRYNSLLK